MEFEINPYAGVQLERDDHKHTQWLPYTKLPDLSINTTNGLLHIPAIEGSGSSALNFHAFPYVFSMIDSRVEYSDAWHLYHYPLLDTWNNFERANYVFLSYGKDQESVDSDIKGLQVLVVVVVILVLLLALLGTGVRNPYHIHSKTDDSQ